jgi:hypothetical protein
MTSAASHHGVFAPCSRAALQFRLLLTNAFNTLLQSANQHTIHQFQSMQLQTNIENLRVLLILRFEERFQQEGNRPSKRGHEYMFSTEDARRQNTPLILQEGCAKEKATNHVRMLPFLSKHMCWQHRGCQHCG